MLATVFDGAQQVANVGLTDVLNRLVADRRQDVLLEVSPCLSGPAVAVLFRSMFLQEPGRSPRTVMTSAGAFVAFLSRCGSAPFATAALICSACLRASASVTAG
jgi:hypothetical protein